jgi:heptosyltransferase-3
VSRRDTLHYHGSLSVRLYFSAPTAVRIMGPSAMTDTKPALGVVRRRKGAVSPKRYEPVTRPQERIIIYRLGSLGDTVAALPCFHLIERAYPTSERIVLTNVPVSSKAAPLEMVLKPGGFIHGSIPYPVRLRSPKRLAQLAMVLRAQHAHTLIYMAASRGLTAAWRDVAFFKLCGFKRIIGAPLTPDLQANRLDASGHVERESHRLARTVQALGVLDLADRGYWDLRLTEREYAVADDKLGARGQIRSLAVNTGGKAAEKDWGTAAWKVLLASLGEQLPDWELVFVGGPEDRKRSAELRSAWPGPVTDLCGELTVRESAAALSRATLFVGHDSGAFHLADAVGTPALGLFGDYNRPNMWHPSGPRTRVLHDMSGLKNISPSEVLRAALEIAPPRHRR